MGYPKVVTIILECPRPFEYGLDNRATAAQRWPRWLSDFENYVDGSGVVVDTQKLSILLHVAGAEVRELVSSVKVTGDDYAKIKKKISDHFAPTANTDFETFNFGEMRQVVNETVSDFAVRLRVQAGLCSFGDVKAMEK